MKYRMKPLDDGTFRIENRGNCSKQLGVDKNGNISSFNCDESEAVEWLIIEVP